MNELFSGSVFTLLMPYIYLLAGLAVLIISGNLLVSGSVQLARYFKISTLVMGLTVVAFGTSAPELFVSAGAALNNMPEIALGNVIGSNIANIGFILGFVALISPIPIHNKAIGFDLLAMFFVTFLLLLFGLNGSINRFEGIFLVVVLIAYTVWSIAASRKKTKAENTETAGINSAKKSLIKKPLIAGLMIIAAITGLYFGSGWFVTGARDIALHWGVSERVIATSIVAVGTSMPELIASLIAAIKKEADLSVGNIIGSNIFNITSVLGITAIINPLSIGSQSLFIIDMIWVFGISIALFLTMIPLSKGKIKRWEGIILLALFLSYICILYTASN